MEQAQSTATPITTLLRAYSLPALGVHWREQGGIFIGIKALAAGMAAVILPTDPRARLEPKEWGVYGTDVPGAKDPLDGRANTLAMAEAGSELAKEILALEIEGFNDLHLATRLEQQLARAHAPGVVGAKDWCWTSEQYSPSSAWVQVFENGSSDLYYKDNEFPAVVVRSFIL